jgi:hypothetical protein
MQWILVTTQNLERNCELGIIRVRFMPLGVVDA